jgi:hypothetical protein
MSEFSKKPKDILILDCEYLSGKAKDYEKLYREAFDKLNNSERQVANLKSKIDALSTAIASLNLAVRL